MRILFVATPMIGHLFPMMPLALHLAGMGHEVTVATGGDAAAAASGSLPVVTVAPRVDFRRITLRALALHPRAVLDSAAGMADPRAGARVFAVVNSAMIDEVGAVVDRIRPALVVHEPFAVAGALAAGRAGVPSVLHNIALDNGTELLRATVRRLGADPAAVPASAATLSIAPPSVVSVPGRPMQYRPYSTPGGVVPQWLRDTPRRPRIVVTRSTMLGDGKDAMLASILRAAPHVDAEFVIVRPNRRIARAAHLPGNVRTVGWIPLHAIAHTCAAMVNHGGAGSVFQALLAGVPQIATPAPGDRAWNAALVQRRGAGSAVRARAIGASDLTHLITSPDLAASAADVAAEIKAQPTVAEVAAELVALAAA